MSILSKKQLIEEMKKFHQDRDRGISIELFCELAGITKATFMCVFVNESYPLSEVIQIRVNRAYRQWKQGVVKIMKRNDNTKYVDYRKTPVPPLLKSMTIKLGQNGPRLENKVINRHDYANINNILLKTLI